jgi:nucleoside-diphosphate kinase
LACGGSAKNARACARTRARSSSGTPCPVIRKKPTLLQRGVDLRGDGGAARLSSSPLNQGARSMTGTDEGMTWAPIFTKGKGHRGRLSAVAGAHACRAEAGCRRPRPSRTYYPAVRRRLAEDHRHENARDGRRLHPQHYFDLEERTGPAVYNATAEFMQRGPVIAFVVEGEDAVATVRKIVGSTYPNEAQPGSIRGDFAHQTKAVAVATGKAVANLVHASGNREEAEYEVSLWFDKTELFEYRSQAEAFGW